MILITIIVMNSSVRAWKKWSQMEKDFLRMEFEFQRSFFEIAEIHQRTEGAIKSMAKKLKLM